MAERSPEASSPFCIVLFCGLQDPSQVTADCPDSQNSRRRSLEVLEVEEPFSVTRPLFADWHLGYCLVSY